MMKNNDYQLHLIMLKEAVDLTKECAVNIETLFSTDAMEKAMDKINFYVEKNNNFTVDIDDFSNAEKVELTPLMTDFFQALEDLTQKIVELSKMDQDQLTKIRNHEKTAVAYAKISGAYN